MRDTWRQSFRKRDMFVKRVFVCERDIKNFRLRDT